MFYFVYLTSGLKGYNLHKLLAKFGLDSDLSHDAKDDCVNLCDLVDEASQGRPQSWYSEFLMSSYKDVALLF